MRVTLVYTYITQPAACPRLYVHMVDMYGDIDA